MNFGSLDGRGIERSGSDSEFDFRMHGILIFNTFCIQVEILSVGVADFSLYFASIVSAYF